MDVLAEQLRPRGFRKGGFYLWRRIGASWTVVWLFRLDKPARENELSVMIDVGRHFADSETVPKTYRCDWIGEPFTIDEGGTRTFSWSVRSEADLKRVSSLFRSELIPQILRIEEILATKQDLMERKSPYSGATLDPYGRIRGFE